MSTHELAEPFERLLADACPPAQVRALERGGDARPLWERLEASGFVDTLVPESAGGAGLRLADAFPLFVVEGRHALPLPLAQTMLVRALLARDGIAAPPGSIAIAAQTRVALDGAISCAATPYGLVADWVVVALADGWRVLPTARANRRLGCVALRVLCHHLAVLRFGGRAKQSGVETDVTFATLYTLRDAKIAVGREYWTREEALEAVGLKE